MPSVNIPSAATATAASATAGTAASATAGTAATTTATATAAAARSGVTPHLGRGERECDERGDGAVFIDGHAGLARERGRQRHSARLQSIDDDVRLSILEAFGQCDSLEKIALDGRPSVPHGRSRLAA